MDKSIKTLIKMSLALHNLRVFCKYSPMSFIQNSHSHTLKKETLPVSIYKQLSDEPSEIFTYIEKNQEYLSGQHCVEALQKLRKLSDQINEKNCTGLVQLCNELKKHIRTLDVSDAVVSLRALTKLKISTQTVIYESLLQIIRSNINSLTIDDVINLQIDLQNVEKRPLVEAILIALPTLFEIQLPRIDRSNISLLAMSLVFVTKQRIKNKKSIQFILDTISNYEDKIPLTAAKYIFTSMTFVPEIADKYKNVFYRVQGVLLDEISSLKYIDTMTILRSIANSRSKSFYKEHLVDALVNSMIIDDLSFEKGAEALKMLVKIGHEQIPLLDYLATKFFEQSDLVKNEAPTTLAPFVSAMAMSDYKPVFWDKIQELIMANKYIPTYEKLLNFVYNLAILDCYNSKLLTLVLKQNTLINFMSPYTKRLIVKLYQIVKTLYLGYDEPCSLKNPDMFFDWNQYNTRTFPLLPALKIALGGPEFIITKVGTRFGHFIDHVIVYKRKDGLPVPINHEKKNKFSQEESVDNVKNSEEEDKALNNPGDFSKEPVVFLEDISVPKDSEIILFLNIPPEGYIINTMQLKGSWNSYIRTLEAMKYLVIPISSKKWQNLKDKEKIPYIMHAIRLKCVVSGTQQ